MIILALWRPGLWRADGEKLGFFLGLDADPLDLSRDGPMWRILGRRSALAAARRESVAWLEYRMNLFDGTAERRR